LPNQKENRNIPPELSGAAGVADALTAICAILIFAAFVFGNWLLKALFRASEKAAGKFI